jgi:tetratricopeptide (TPR) repeat protein
MMRHAVIGISLAAVVLSFLPGCTEKSSHSDLYVLEELEAASRGTDPEKRVERLMIFTGNHPDHPYRVLGHRRVFEALALESGDIERASAYLDKVLSSERQDRVRGDLLYGKFSLLWGVDRESAVALAEDLVTGTEKYYRMYFYLALYLMEDETQGGLAERCFLKAAELAPHGAEKAQVLGEYGMFLEAGGRTDEALEVLAKAAAYGYANEVLGQILWERGEHEAAIEAYLRFAAVVPAARGKINLDSLYAVVHAGAGNLSDEIMTRRIFDGELLPDEDFVDIEGRQFNLGDYRGSPLALFVFSPT